LWHRRFEGDCRSTLTDKRGTWFVSMETSCVPLLFVDGTGNIEDPLAALAPAPFSASGLSSPSRTQRSPTRSIQCRNFAVAVCERIRDKPVDSLDGDGITSEFGAQ
jgi:hypothetical protein